MDLAENRRLQRALEAWQPNYLQWWQELGPHASETWDVYLRTATHLGAQGWAHFDYVRMPEYRWGIFLAEPEPNRTIPFGDNKGAPVWQEVPGEFRTQLRRLIVTQGDTEPASVEQQRHLGATCPSLYDLRNLLQVNVEEGRHLWAMVHLLHAHFGRDGREEAEELLHRHSGDPDRPRILGAFNEPTPDWLSFFMVRALHGPRREVPVGLARRVGLRPAGAHLPVHAHGRGAPPLRGRGGSAADRAAHG